MCVPRDIIQVVTYFVVFSFQPQTKRASQRIQESSLIKVLSQSCCQTQKFRRQITRCSGRRRNIRTFAKSIPDTGCNWSTSGPRRRSRTACACRRTTRPGPWCRAGCRRRPSPTRTCSWTRLQLGSDGSTCKTGWCTAIRRPTRPPGPAGPSSKRVSSSSDR